MALKSTIKLHNILMKLFSVFFRVGSCLNLSKYYTNMWSLTDILLPMTAKFVIKFVMIQTWLSASRMPRNLCTALRLFKASLSTLVRSFEKSCEAMIFFIRGPTKIPTLTLAEDNSGKQYWWYSGY